MKYVSYKLSFTTALHVGKRLLTDGEKKISSDTIFSALCHEALRIGGVDELNKLVKMVKDNELRLSDAFPYMNDTYYVPKPLIQVDGKNVDDGNSTQKKSFKKLEYIPCDEFECYIKGEFDSIKCDDIVGKLESLGTYEVASKVQVNVDKDSEPYDVGYYKFASNCGLYIIVGFEGSDDLVYKIFNSLSYTGIGGKVSAGYGKFCLSRQELSEEMLSRLSCDSDVYMSISMSMSKEDELEKSLVGATYLLEKRSGFVSSTNYSDEFVRKNDFYSFRAGSCFINKYDGDVYDVSCNGNHPVYRYAKPIFMGVK